MSRANSQPLSASELLAAEVGTCRKDAPRRVALTYPSPYRAAMSSLGYQTIYGLINDHPEYVADRAMLPDHPDDARGLFTLERNLALGNYRVVAFSVAYELEIAGLVQCLELAGIPVLREERGPRDPVIIAGGPLTNSNPTTLAPFCDVVVLGEGEDLTLPLLDAAWQCDHDPRALGDAVAGTHGYYVPAIHGDDVPPIAAADNSTLPARSRIMTPHTELSSMFMTEAARGCSRGCHYCVMRRSTNGGMRIVAPDDVLGGIPETATRVGLVGAAVTDHPRIRDIVRGVVDGGRGIGISSLRADKLDDELVELLARGGYRTLTTASDGASERLRTDMERRTTSEHLLRTAELANRHKLRRVKLYMVLGLPTETNDDIDECIAFTLELTKVHPRIALGVAPFVAKRHTPLDGAPFAGIDVVDARLKRLRKGLKGRATVRPTSARWAWVEYMIAQGDHRAGLACMDAHRAGGSFAAYKRAFEARGAVPTGPRARVPSTKELLAIRRRPR